ncbi:NADH-ubiquinone oxidoreductase-F iron-sulfur binding region domain-containing protein [Actinomadura sp. DC4]|uniref:NADH-ubiquinone oxidoreductase-F iron-sulfur binding region domain-containing protein n=1 Tax=Actinomadura sp. DC4 TaxID=3055069 RepID=UPI0025B14F65|nr:NADH-ubiquinone oxidoreductase-F iron-sulfur binding region domain-containing protein [Actinomadura sp. DC4]MDN3359793.1 NADH-ubiquinone oxidoreductase-F iron-sulfur binding region domain-containing protein [Actinomadura sp. DC4]
MTVEPAPRLLAGYQATGRAADLREHLSRYGPAPFSGHGSRARAGAWPIGPVEEAGLTGRGGGGFPMARKMRSVAASGRPAVVVVNAAEGEPLSGKDRLLLTVAPHLVLDGAALAAYAVGARRIIVCVHGSGDAAAHLETAVAERAGAGLNAVPVEVRRIPGRYVASEETALVNQINGGAAKPTFTPPRPYERGVGGLPTLVANAETYAHIALILRYGPAWFRACGTADAPGTALFSVSGAVVRPGVVEAPLGTSAADLLRLAGGPADPLQAVLTGGYGGTWLTMRQAHTPTTPAAFAAAGAALGPGIVVALAARACGLAESARILRWLADQTAGQCGPCVFGLPAIAEDFAALAAGRAGPALHRRLRSRVAVIPGRGACRHPDGAARFAASALRVFGPHLDAHERPGGCPPARRPSLLPARWGT